MKHNKSNAGSRALKIVQRYHPGVTNVVDAKNDLVIEVAKEDDIGGKLKNHAQCAMARACQRQEHADGAIISVRAAYVIKGDTAYRYRVGESISREIVSFDRKGGFVPGVYKLSKPHVSDKLGSIQSGKKPDRPSNRPGPMFQHKTENIRANLNKLA